MCHSSCVCASYGRHSDALIDYLFVCSGSSGSCAVPDNTYVINSVWARQFYFIWDILGQTIFCYEGHFGGVLHYCALSTMLTKPNANRNPYETPVEVRFLLLPIDITGVKWLEMSNNVYHRILGKKTVLVLWGRVCPAQVSAWHVDGLSDAQDALSCAIMEFYGTSMTFSCKIFVTC